MSFTNGGNIYGLPTIGNMYLGRGLTNATAISGRPQVDVAVDGTTITINSQNKLVADTANILFRTQPEYYGAVGDGVTDDTAAVNACIAASNGLVELTQTYLVYGVSIKGDTVYRGPGTLLAKAGVTYGDNTSAIYGENATNGSSTYPVSALSNVVFDGVVIDGNATNISSKNVPYILSLKYARDIKFLNCRFKNIGGYGIRLNGKYTVGTISNDYDYPTADIYCRNILIDGCSFHDAGMIYDPGSGDTVFGGTAIQFVGVEDSVISNNNFYNCFLGAGVDFLNRCISVTGNSSDNDGSSLFVDSPSFYVGQASVDVTVANNAVLNAGWIGIYVESAAYTSVTGNTIRHTDGAYSAFGIRVAPNQLWLQNLGCTDILIANNIVEDASAPIVCGSDLLASEKNIIVTNNIATARSLSDDPAIVFYQTTQATISGNHTNARVGIYLSRAVKFNVTGNSINNAFQGIYVGSTSTSYLNLDNNTMISPRASSTYLVIDNIPANTIRIVNTDMTPAATAISYNNGASASNVNVVGQYTGTPGGAATFAGDLTTSGNLSAAAISGTSGSFSGTVTVNKLVTTAGGGGTEQITMGNGTYKAFQFGLDGTLSSGSTPNLSVYRYANNVYQDSPVSIEGSTGNLYFRKPLDMQSQKITSLATPTNATDAATKGYADSISAGLKPKGSVVAASTANVNLGAFPSTLDGVSLIPGDTVLLKDQSTGTQNGVYEYVGGGVANRATGWTLTTAASNFYVFVMGGTTNAYRGYSVTNASGSDVIGTDALVFGIFTLSTSYTFSTGLTNTGGTITVNAAQPGITSLGTLSALSVSGSGTLTSGAQIGGNAGWGIYPGSGSPEALKLVFGDGSGWKLNMKKGDGTLLSYLKDNGEFSTIGKIYGVGLDAGGALVTGVSTPVSSTDAANKAYVDASFAGGGSGTFDTVTATTVNGTNFVGGSYTGTDVTASGNVTVSGNIFQPSRFATNAGSTLSTIALGTTLNLGQNWTDSGYNTPNPLNNPDYMRFPRPGTYLLEMSFVYTPIQAPIDYRLQLAGSFQSGTGYGEFNETIDLTNGYVGGGLYRVTYTFQKLISITSGGQFSVVAARAGGSTNITNIQWYASVTALRFTS